MTPSTTLEPAPQATRHHLKGGRWIEHWDPEDESFWKRTGQAVARRNLIFSIFAEHLGFSVWLLWSVVVVSLPGAGFTFSVDQLFWLARCPASWARPCGCPTPSRFRCSAGGTGP